MNRLYVTGFLVVTFLVAGCRGMVSESPPIHPNLNMDLQERFDPMEPNPFFADNRSMRLPVPGTVARGMLREDDAFYLGRTDGGAYISEIPVPVTRTLLERGQDRYDIFCAVCHGAAGDAQGIIMVGTSTITGSGYGYTPAPTFHDDRLRGVEDGYLYDVITNGVRNMPAYGPQIPVMDRWAIVAYVRALQRSQHATLEDIPPAMRGSLQQVTETPAAADTAAADTAAATPDTTAGDTLSP